MVNYHGDTLNDVDAVDVVFADEQMDMLHIMNMLQLLTPPRPPLLLLLLLTSWYHEIVDMMVLLITIGHLLPVSPD